MNWNAPEWLIQKHANITPTHWEEPIFFIRQSSHGNDVFHNSVYYYKPNAEQYTPNTVAIFTIKPKPCKQ